MDVFHENYNNYTLAAEDVGWIETDIIVLHKINWFDAWVDYTGTKGEMSNRRGGSFVVKHMQRKAVDQVKPATGSDWQILYEKSIQVK